MSRGPYQMTGHALQPLNPTSNGLGTHTAGTMVNLPRGKSQYLSQVLAAVAISLGPLAAGLGKGYSSPAIASLQGKQSWEAGHGAGAYRGHGLGHRGNYTLLTVSPQEASWVASLSLLGALFGALVGGLAMKFGRKNVLLIASLPFSASWLVTVYAESVQTMFATSFVGGFCCAVVLMVSQVYISEISDPDIRGFLSAVLKIFSHIGTLLSLTLGAYLDWRELAMIISGAPLLLFVSMLYMPETPSFLVLSGREPDAVRALRFLRGNDTDITRELITIRNNILTASTHQYTYRGLAHAAARLAHPILITCGLMFFQRFSGANAFQFYSVTIFSQTFNGMNPHGGAIVVGFVQLLASLLSGLLIDTIGRLPLLIASSVFMSIALAGFGSFVYYEQLSRHNSYVHVQHLPPGVAPPGISATYDWIPLLCVLVFTVSFSMGISPISWLLIGELFPLEYRGLGSALATSFSYACAFIGVKTYVDFTQTLGLHGAFWLYAAFSLAGLCFIVCFVPETKGRDLDELDSRYI
ncbi:unnamed protein product [Bemisia tabaci]|uniref:Major facilitator superfamily (MFS) profile domain-containing protein n=2 Tax=Bemisia tabaci TaxID=7038 RepID=A0A9P0G1G9_BEMTA|nr:unnamed protein product [Bemisia tabaci]